MNSAPTLSLPLNARQLANSLIPRIEILEEFLLWPPDLFALTSQILSTTGAYHLVISPPKLEETDSKVVWPPEDDWAEPSWDKYVRRVGMEWRHMLESEESIKKELMGCKQSQRDAQRRKLLIHAKTGYSVMHDRTCEWKAGQWIPTEVGRHWITFCRGMDRDLRGNIEDFLCSEEKNIEAKDQRKNWEGFKALLTLHAITDEACIGWGIRDLRFQKDATGNWELDKSDNTTESAPARFAAECLRDNGTMATIHNQRGRVLPKRHTPQVGITLRSLTSNLAYHRSSVDVKWKLTANNSPSTRIAKDRKPSVNSSAGRNLLIRRMESKEQEKVFSVLLLPWPMKIRALDFTPVENKDRLRMDDKKYGLFSYAPRKRWFNEEMLRAALNGALEETNTVDMVVLPECALSKSEIDTFESVIGSENYRVSSYVAGVRDNPKGNGSKRFNYNMVYFKMGDVGEGKHDVVNYPPLDPKLNSDEIQYKHHRWKLERLQITNYSLGHVLPPHKDWWESIKIRRRKVTFINVGRELTICPLICEDLARQDPIADLIRTVGPSLVITILMDGPQKKERWSARYASVLSEDPGSAVITLTSVGLVNRWRHPYHSPSRVVALWNDGKGLEREIELEENSIGILLSLSIDGNNEPTADGRIEYYPTNTVTLGGIHQIREKSK